MSTLRSPIQSSSTRSEAELTQQNDNDDDGNGLFSDALSNTVEVPIHATCPKCNHFHTNKLLGLSLDISNHVRFRCDKCDHHIFGIGRTSTQTTLASAESLLIPPPRLNRNSTIPRPPRIQICASSAEEVQTTYPPEPSSPVPQTPLSTIDESHSPAGRSRSTSNLPSPGNASVRLEGTTLSSSGGGRESSIVIPQPSSEPPELPRPVQRGRHPLSKLKNVWRRTIHKISDGSEGKKRKLSRIIKVGSIFTRRKNKGPAAPDSLPPQMSGIEHSDLGHPASYPSAEAMPGSARTRTLSQAPTRELASSHGDSRPSSTESVMDPPTRDRGSPSRDSASATRNSRESEAGVDPSQPEEPDNISQPSTNAGQQLADRSAAEIKRDRLRDLRREKTLRKEIATRPRCECHAGCHCHGVNQPGESDVASEPQRNSNSDFEPPDHPVIQHLLDPSPASAPASPIARASAVERSFASAFGGMMQSTSERGTQLSGIGGLFFPRTLAHRLSQATTIQNGSSSSISLTSYPGRALNRPPDPSVRSMSPEVVQRNGVHTSSTLSDRDSDSEDFRDSFDETIANGPPMHAGITAPANIPDTPNGPQPLVQGRSTSLSIQTSNLLTANGSSAPESQEATPRPSSNNELSEEPVTFPQPEAAAISSALQGLNSTR